MRSVVVCVIVAAIAQLADCQMLDGSADENTLRMLGHELQEEVRKMQDYQARHNVTSYEAVRSILGNSTAGKKLAGEKLTGEKLAIINMVRDLINCDPDYYLSQTHGFTTEEELAGLNEHLLQSGQDQWLVNLDSLRNDIEQWHREVRDHQARYNVTNDEAMPDVVNNPTDGDDKRDIKRRIMKIIRENPKYYLLSISDDLPTEEELNERCEYFRRQDEREQQMLYEREFMDTLNHEVQKLRNYQSQHDSTPEEAVQFIMPSREEAATLDEKRKKVLQFIRDDSRYFLTRNHNFTTGNELKELFQYFEEFDKHTKLRTVRGFAEAMRKEVEEVRKYKVQHNVTGDEAVRALKRNLPTAGNKESRLKRTYYKIILEDPERILTKIHTFTLENEWARIFDLFHELHQQRIMNDYVAERLRKALDFIGHGAKAAFINPFRRG